jgi:hypothetical protein
MLPCVEFVYQRLATAPADNICTCMMAHMSWRWAEVVMEHVTRSHEESAGAAAAARVLCAALRLSCQCLRALCVFDACCRERCLNLR